MDATPASPLSCASTASAPSDDAVDLDGDPGRSVQTMEMMAAGQEQLGQLEQGAQLGQTTLAVREQHHGHESSRHAGEGDVRVELELPPEASAHVANGAASAPQAARHVRNRAVRNRVAKRHASRVMTDAEMIASLAGCASLPPTPATTLAQQAVPWEGHASDSDLVAALAADALVSCPGGGHEASDQELAAALAVCAGETDKELADKELKDPHLAPLSPDMQHWSQAGHAEIGHDDGVLEMALFHGTHYR